MEVSSLSPSTTSSEPRHFDEDDYLDRDLSEDKKEGEEEEEDDIFSDECKPRPPPREESGTRRRWVWAGVHAGRPLPAVCCVWRDDILTS